MKLLNESISLLKALIKTSSISKEEGATAQIIKSWLSNYNIKPQTHKNNVWAVNKHFNPERPTILLNSHHDTVAPNSNYTKNPFNPIVEKGKLYGLGSNDAGGSLVALLAVFVHFYNQSNLNYNLVIAATAEEEISGVNGISSILSLLPPIDFAIVGEPTEMQLAIAEKGLLVIDGCTYGKSGHAANYNAINAIYQAIKDIDWIQNYEFKNASALLGKVKMTVTQINAGKQHNVVPGECHFTIDVRVNEHYTNEEVFEVIDQHTQSELKARSFRLNSSSIPVNHPFVKAGIKHKRTTYGSPTLSDQALLSCPSVKMGPGKSERSHTADEFIYLKEIEEGITIYKNILNEILL
ncbi:MAG: M20 family metallo-hydrolase [Flavobacteriales bacterium]|nr:M20 family metallo-hydrolase [Flavobacteriales bacterium]MCB9363374.1 M20 family metallo-hydrolase [Flavobacteriales bacterium]